VTPSTTRPAAATPHVIGSQDPAPQQLFAPGDLLVIDRGSAGGLQLNQQFFIRRPMISSHVSGEPRDLPAETTGWATIVAVDARTAIARIDQACDAISIGNYLEPFQAPEVPDSVLRVDRSGNPDFQDMAHVLFGDEERTTAGTGDFMLIDRGSLAGVSVGSRFAIYRDKGAPGLPLAWVGEAAVVATGPSLSLVRIDDTIDAVARGDFAAPRRQ
jgi:hypothetical protein